MRVIVMMAVLVAGGCAASLPPYAPRTHVAPAGVTDADLYAASVRVLMDRGWSLRDKDADAGMVATEWINVGLVPFVGVHYHSWRAVIANGQLRLAIDCELARDGHRYNCDGNGRNATFAQDAPALRVEIFRAAIERARKRAAGTAPASQPAL